MLVLSRKRGQVIVIGQGADTITIRVTSIENNHVELGIDAPKNVRIDRLEVSRDRSRMTHRETDLTVLRDIYLQGVIDNHYGLSLRVNPKWGETANKAYALAFKEYQNA